MNPLDHFLKSDKIKRDKDKIKDVLDRDMFSHNNLGSTLKSVFNPTPQVVQQRREAAKTFLTPTPRNDMIGSAAMVMGKTLATPQAPISKGAGALATRIPTLDKRNDMVGTMGAGLIMGRAVAQQREVPIKTMITTSKSNPLNLPTNKSLSWSTATPDKLLGKESNRLLMKDYTTNAPSTIPSFKNDLGMRPPTLQSPGRISTPIQVASSDKFLPNTSGNAMQNIGALNAAGSKSLGSWLTGGK